MSEKTMSMKYRLELVHFLPADLTPGILYVSEEYGIAAHLCPCGCGSKINTPLSETDWSIKIEDNYPTLYPSIGNWQLACQSHYWIIKGNVVWAKKWTTQQILDGRSRESKTNKKYYRDRYLENNKVMRFFSNLLSRLFKCNN